jgi:MFS family permease
MNLTAPISFIPINDYIKAFNMPIIKQLFSMWFLYVMAFSMMQTIVALLWKEHYHQDDRHIGYLFTIIGVSSALVQGGLVGVLVKKLGENKMLIYGTFLMIAGFALLPVVPVKRFWLGSCLAIVLLSLGSGCLTPSTTALISKAADAHEQGRMLGLSQSVGSMSRVLGPMMSGFVYSIHFAAPFLNSSLLMVACLFLAQVIIGLLSKKEKTQGV